MQCGQVWLLRSLVKCSTACNCNWLLLKNLWFDAPLCVNRGMVWPWKHGYLMAQQDSRLHRTWIWNHHRARTLVRFQTAARTMSSWPSCSTPDATVNQASCSPFCSFCQMFITMIQVLLRDPSNLRKMHGTPCFSWAICPTTGTQGPKCGR